MVELTEKLNTSSPRYEGFNGIKPTRSFDQGSWRELPRSKSMLSREEEVITKSRNTGRGSEKIAKYAASLINKEDIVYLDMQEQRQAK